MLKELFDIYFTSLKVGAMTFGGGYAMLPILQKEVVEKKAWNTEEEILDYYALAQCLPGIIMVNTLGFVGQKRKGTADYHYDHCSAFDRFRGCRCGSERICGHSRMRLRTDF